MVVFGTVGLPGIGFVVIVNLVAFGGCVIDGDDRGLSEVKNTTVFSSMLSDLSPSLFGSSSRSSMRFRFSSTPAMNPRYSACLAPFA